VGAVKSLHAYRASGTRLKISISPKPRAPMYLGWIILSQATQLVFLLSFLLLVTPRVSNPHDYVNHMFERL
jgi:hypothetical protein